MIDEVVHGRMAEEIRNMAWDEESRKGEKVALVHTGGLRGKGEGRRRGEKGGERYDKLT